MKRITINNKEYIFEFTIEASLYDECTKSFMDTFVKGGMAQGAAELNDVNAAMDNLLDTIANLPQKTLTLFYAGLLEHHGSDGDGSVRSKNDAKKILALYLKENNKSFREVMGEMMNLMAEDHFFELIGLDKVTEELESQVEEQTKAINGNAGKNTSTKK